MQTIKLPFKIKRPMLAFGADMKGAFALARVDKAYLVDGFGDLSDADNFKAYEKAISCYEKKLGIRPTIIACDHHPDYFSSRFAEAHAQKLGLSEPFRVQHHEAHIASAIVEHSIKGDVIGVAFDGTGYGMDSNIWGGEFFVGNPGNLKRVAHFEYVPMPGGAAAIKEPWRMALSYLYKAFGEDLFKQNFDIINKQGKKRLAVVRKMIDNNINSPLTSSAGRLFDAVGSLVLSKDAAAFEAELPIEMEKIATQNCDSSYRFDITTEGEMVIIGISKLVKDVVTDLKKAVAIGIVSAKFHNTIAEIIAELVSRISKKVRSRKVILSGGVFQNKYLTKRADSILKKKDFAVYIHSKINTNDSGVPIGQLAIANARISCA